MRNLYQWSKPSIQERTSGRQPPRFLVNTGGGLVIAHLPNERVVASRQFVHSWTHGENASAYTGSIHIGALSPAGREAIPALLNAGLLGTWSMNAAVMVGGALKRGGLALMLRVRVAGRLILLLLDASNDHKDDTADDKR